MLRGRQSRVRGVAESDDEAEDFDQEMLAAVQRDDGESDDLPAPR